MALTEMGVRTKVTESVLRILASRAPESTGRGVIYRGVHSVFAGRGDRLSCRDFRSLTDDVLLALHRDQIIEPLEIDRCGLGRGRGRGHYRLLDPPVMTQGEHAGRGDERERRTERVVSMIYELPTNDIPVNRLAASVIGPVWGSTGLL